MIDRQLARYYASHPELKQSFYPLENLWCAIQNLGGPVVTHTHLDRADTITPEMWKYVDAKLEQKWDIVDKVKSESTESDIYNRMMRVTERLYIEGVRVIGSFIDVDKVVGHKAMKAADRLRKAWGKDLEFKFANQTLKGVIDLEAYKWFRDGAEWADIVGGLPGKDKPHRREHIQIVLGTAKELGKMAHVHVDQLNNTNEKETEMLAEETINLGMKNKVVAVHSISLAAHGIQYREKVYGLMNKAGLMAVSCPTAWLNSRRHEQLQVSHNAVTPIDELTKFGITCGLGPDNIHDVYMPFTNGSMKTELQVLLEANHHYDPDNLALIATENGRKVLGLSHNGHF